MNECLFQEAGDKADQEVDFLLEGILTEGFNGLVGIHLSVSPFMAALPVEGC
jgi:hypothetical protein